MSEVFTPAELSMASVLSRTPAQRRLDPPALRHAEIGALSDHLGGDLAAGHPDGVIGAVADRVVGLGRGAHIGADAAEEQEIDRRLEDGVHQLAAASPCPRREPSSACACGDSAISLRVRENTPPPSEISVRS